MKHVKRVNEASTLFLVVMLKKCYFIYGCKYPVDRTAAVFMATRRQAVRFAYLGGILVPSAERAVHGRMESSFKWREMCFRLRAENRRVITESVSGAT